MTSTNEHYGYNSLFLKEFKGYISTRDIINTRRWRDVRSIALKVFGDRCLNCGDSENIQIDHIHPVSRYPHLSYNIENMQPLCKRCNGIKSARVIDYRDEWHRGLGAGLMGAKCFDMDCALRVFDFFDNEG